MSRRTPVLPGAPRRRAPLLNEISGPYDRPALQQKILDALADGPLEKWRIRERIHEYEHRVGKELTALRHAGQVKRTGLARQSKWALASWRPPAAAAPVQHPENTVVRKRKAPADSWWARPNQTRADFNAALENRQKEMRDALGPRPHDDA